MPNPLRPILGFYRLAAIVIAILMGMLVILVTSPLPIRIRRVRLAAWPVTLLARLFVLLFNIKIEAENPWRLLRHYGFILPNHCSALDIVTILYYLPARFLAAMEVRRRPLIGWIAQAIGTVFVERENRASRYPKPEDDPARMAAQTEAMISETLDREYARLRAQYIAAK